jgi:5'-3' exonuclease
MYLYRYKQVELERRNTENEQLRQRLESDLAEMRTEMMKGQKEAAAVIAKFNETLQQLKELQEKSDKEKIDHMNLLAQMNQKNEQMNQEFAKQMAAIQQQMLATINQGNRRRKKRCIIT